MWEFLLPSSHTHTTPSCNKRLLYIRHNRNFPRKGRKWNSTSQIKQHFRLATGDEKCSTVLGDKVFMCYLSGVKHGEPCRQLWEWVECQGPLEWPAGDSVHSLDTACLVHGEKWRRHRTQSHKTARQCPTVNHHQPEVEKNAIFRGKDFSKD